MLAGSIPGQKACTSFAGVLSGDPEGRVRVLSNYRVVSREDGKWEEDGTDFGDDSIRASPDPDTVEG